jgi:hypothetical protein
MQPRQARQKRWLICSRILFGISFLLFVSYLCALTYHDITSPTTPDEASGYIYARFDKIHGRYIYLDEAGRDLESKATWCSFGSIAFTFVIAAKVQSLLSKSKPRTGLNEEDRK